MVSPSTPAVSPVKIKLPNFWTQNPEAWFQHAEAQFALWNVTSSETHYFYVDSTLDACTAVRVAPFLTNFRTPHDYMELKTLLLDTFGLLDDERAYSSTCITEVGDRHPSDVMDQMLLLHCHKERNFLLCHAFKKLLPPAVHHAFAAFPSTNPCTWAREADRA